MSDPTVQLTGNRRGNDDYIPRCPNTDAATGVCMYVGPCLVCAVNRTRHRTRFMTLGTVVYLHTATRPKVHVIVAEPKNGRVQLAQCGSARWFRPQWHDVGMVGLAIDEKHPHVRRARRMLAKASHDPDGWIRIPCGRYPSIAYYTIGHVNLQPEPAVKS